MRGKSLMFQGTASPVSKSLFCAAALRSYGVDGGGYLCLAVKDRPRTRGCWRS